VAVQLVDYQEGAGDAGGGRKQSYFVELWDVGEPPVATCLSKACIRRQMQLPAQSSGHQRQHCPGVGGCSQHRLHAAAGTHDRYKALRPVFYNQLNGVILVHELANGRCKTTVAWNSDRPCTGVSTRFVLQHCSARLYQEHIAARSAVDTVLPHPLSARPYRTAEGMRCFVHRGQLMQG
jgi:hypothetical protein